MLNTLSKCVAIVVLAVGSSAMALAEEPPTPPAIDLSKEATLYVVGYAHLDTQWRWTYVETIRDYIADTLNDNFELMEKYPSYVFNFGGSRRYEMMEEYYPEQFAKLHEYVAKGQWFPSGSSVDENDANVPSAESLIRQVLYGNRYFQREFGVSSQEFMLPDCFGFPAALPTALAHCGLRGFSTQKLTWGSAVGIPFKVGVWEGPDGSSVIAALDPGAYVGEVRSDLSMNDSWLTRVNNNGQQFGLYSDYHYYGTGDMGGAPTEQSVAMIEKSVHGEGPLKIVSGPADWLFRTITPEQRERLPRYKGELLLTEHSAGSITSQAMMKRWNRKNELLADAAEKAATMAWWMGREYPAARLEKAWGLVLGSQMHDILPGTSHPKAYEYSWNDELLAANQFAAVLTDSVGEVASVMDTSATGTPIVVFNPLSIDRQDVVVATLPWTAPATQRPHVIGPDGKEVPSQVLSEGKSVITIAILAEVPSVGFAVFDVQAGEGAAKAESELHVDLNALENARYRVTLNEAGDVASIFDKKAKREMLAEPARLALMYENPAQWPAWNMDWSDRQNPPRSSVDGPAKVRIAENGPVRVALEVSREHEGSTYVQTIRLAAGEAGDRVEFDNNIDWMTRERSLKASFTLGVSNPKATYDIQIGAIERDNNNAKRYENPSHQWFDLTDKDGSYGVTVANDSKFGSDKPNDNTLRLTMLYTPGTRGGYQDQGTQDIGRHEILYALAGHQGDWREAGTPWIAARLNQPLMAFQTTAHEGSLGKAFSIARVSDSSVMITALKRAEEGNKVVMRLRELTGSDAENVQVTMTRPMRGASEVDGQERFIGTANLADGSLATSVHGYGLRAFAISPGNAPTTVPARRTAAIQLAFDADVISTNANRSDGSISDTGLTLTAEQLPATITAGDVTFELGSTNPGAKNALVCRGQEIALPAGDFDHVELLAASAHGDVSAAFHVDRIKRDVKIPSWQGYIGQWDNRVWSGDIQPVAFNWSPEYAGLEPGYVKQAEVAWYCSHHHAPAGDQIYQYCYLYKISIDVPKGSKALTLPKDERVMLLAATMVNDGMARVSPAAPLFDTLDDRTQDAPQISPSKGTFADITEVNIAPRLYGKRDNIRYTLDGSSPTANSMTLSEPIMLADTATIRAAILDANGKPGPVSEATITVNDRTSPSVVKVAAIYNQPTVEVMFSEPLDRASATNTANYRFEPAIAVHSASVDESARRVSLTIDKPIAMGQEHTLKISNVRDTSPARNAITGASVQVAAPGPVYHLSAVTADQRGKTLEVAGLPVRAKDHWTLNMFVRMDKQPLNRTLIAGFGAAPARAAGGARYISKFSNGIHFWSHNADVPGKTPFDLNRWQMITATYDGTTLRLYKDAQLIAEEPQTFSDDEAVVKIMPIDPWEKERQFEGDVAEMTIWNVALDQTAIQSLQTSAKLP